MAAPADLSERQSICLILMRGGNNAYPGYAS
jgi:hypothetical protein